jgi:hypothetical protein
MADEYPRSPFVAEWEALEARLEAGESFESVEAAIAEAPVDDEERAALWLASWARASRNDRGLRARGLRPQRRRRLTPV